MLHKEIKGVNVVSALKILPLVYLILGLVIGMGSFVYLKLTPTAVAPRIGFFEWLLAIIIYAGVFCLIISAVSILGVFIYNFLSPKLGGVQVSLEVNQAAAEE